MWRLRSLVKEARLPKQRAPFVPYLPPRMRILGKSEGEGTSGGLGRTRGRPSEARTIHENDPDLASGMWHSNGSLPKREIDIAQIFALPSTVINNFSNRQIGRAPFTPNMLPSRYRQLIFLVCELILESSQRSALPHSSRDERQRHPMSSKIGSRDFEFLHGILLCWVDFPLIAEGNRDHPQLAQNSYFETQISIN
jgi:hypothetical protein